jgi:hypothetical protein
VLSGAEQAMLAIYDVVYYPYSTSEFSLSIARYDLKTQTTSLPFAFLDLRESLSTGLLSIRGRIALQPDGSVWLGTGVGNLHFTGQDVAIFDAGPNAQGVVVEERTRLPDGPPHRFVVDLNIVQDGIDMRRACWTTACVRGTCSPAGLRSCASVIGRGTFNFLGRPGVPHIDDVQSLVLAVFKPGFGAGLGAFGTFKFSTIPYRVTGGATAGGVLVPLAAALSHTTSNAAVGSSAVLENGALRAHVRLGPELLETGASTAHFLPDDLRMVTVSSMAYDDDDTLFLVDNSVPALAGVASDQVFGGSLVNALQNRVGPGNPAFARSLAPARHSRRAGQRQRATGHARRRARQARLSVDPALMWMAPEQTTHEVPASRYRRAQ